MPLASTTVIPIGSLFPVELRASLRAAIRLEHRYGFDKLLRGITEGSYSILAAIVFECTSTKDDAIAVLSLRPIGKLIIAAQPPCHALVLALSGHDLGGASETSNAKPVSFSEFYTSLYRLAAGNLGWPPEQAYSATPLEIVEAMKGRAELLQAIFGEAEKPEAAPVDPSTINHSAGIARLREILGSGRSVE